MPSKIKQSVGSVSAQTTAPDREEPNPGPAQQENCGDDDIIKSPSDPKQYRYIELKNGLRALLISDFSSSEEKPEDDEDEDDDTEDEEEEEEEEDDDSEEGTDDELEDDDDEQDSEDEEKEEKKMKKRSEKQSAAALCIGVGSFSDPEDLPGLAHFLEHMVFMGSEKYPRENGFDAFLKKHGGSDNASTDCERTVFQFDVQRKKFREALDRWAQFFICPLMIRDAVEREVEAVDSEYQLAKPSDSHRKEMLFGSLAKPHHPMAKFCWGNAQTLKTEPKKNKINVYKRLRQFWRRHYSAHYMTLTVQSRGKNANSHSTLDTLEEWVRQIFSSVPNNETGFDQNSTYSIFSINITLTDQGFQNFYQMPDINNVLGEQVADQVFQYIKMLQRLGPQRRIYEEIQKIEANEFRYQEQTDPIEYVEDVCENMQLFPKEDFLTGDQLLFQFNPELEYKLTAEEHGLVIKVKGFNHKLRRWSVMQKHQVLVEGISVDELMEFVRSFKEELYAEGLVQGNLTHMEAMDFLNYLTKYHVYPTCRNTSGILGFSVTVETQATKFNTEHVEMKIEEFLQNFGETLKALTDDAFSSHVTALVKLKQCEDTHLGEEVERHWNEVITQQYVFDRLHHEVVGFGAQECDPPSEGEQETSQYGEVSKLSSMMSVIESQMTKQQEMRLRSLLGHARLSLLFKASVHGFNSSTFHQKCDRQGPTVTVAYNTSGYIFGAFTSKDYAQTGQNIADEKAFLFSLNRHDVDAVPLRVVSTEAQRAFTDGNTGPNFVSMVFLYNNTANVYSCPGTYDYDPIEMCGDNLQLSECEVYRVEGFESFMEKPWRNIEWSSEKRKSLKDMISRWTPSVSSVQKARVLLVGAVGAGKSSFFNSINSVFKGHVSCQANTGIAGTSLTTQDRIHTVVFVVDACKIKLLSEKMTDKLAAFRRKANHMVKNYSKELELDMDSDLLLLYSVLQIIRYTDAYCDDLPCTTDAD
ncbi:Nardilysin [Bagarius yarrelli]|uniref:Nardilysin n=1 Tax=Bagarius yarrelli TaxID=175774 RepID=A0A556TZR2_BAGYA|nr:Nardilysin [Bagarius yarrelli]